MLVTLFIGTEVRWVARMFLEIKWLLQSFLSKAHGIYLEALLHFVLNLSSCPVKGV